MTQSDEEDGFANPFLVCNYCKATVTSRSDGVNHPCGHGADYSSVCPSWSPVDGCRCHTHVGSVQRGAPRNIFDK